MEFNQMTVTNLNIQSIENLDELDCEELRRLAKQSMDSMAQEVKELDERHLESMLDYFFSEKGLKKWINSEEFTNSELLVAYSEEEPVGTARYEIKGSEAEIHALYIKPGYTREGVATKIMQEIHKAVGDEVNSIRADVFEGNQPSLKLLGKLGYQQESVDHNVFEEIQGPDAIILKNFCRPKSEDQ